MPLVSEHGFTADVHPRPPVIRREIGNHRSRFALALAVPLVLMTVILATIGRTGADADGDQSTPLGPYYDFRVHALNCTHQSRTTNGTLFRFNAADLPYDFSNVRFGDYKADTGFLEMYYGGSGILVQASGGRSVMTLREGTGRIVDSITYHGQSHIMFNGMAESVTYPCNSTTYEGTDTIIQDWREGIWNPFDGVLIEHAANVTLSGATFYLMTLEPAGTTALPEFEPALMAAGIAGMMILMSAYGRQRKNRNCTVKQ